MFDNYSILVRGILFSLCMVKAAIHGDNHCPSFKWVFLFFSLATKEDAVYDGFHSQQQPGFLTPNYVTPNCQRAMQETLGIFRFNTLGFEYLQSTMKVCDVLIGSFAEVQIRIICTLNLVSDWGTSASLAAKQPPSPLRLLLLLLCYCCCVVLFSWKAAFPKWLKFGVYEKWNRSYMKD